MKKFKLIFAIAALNVILFTACDKDNAPSNEAELITTVEFIVLLEGDTFPTVYTSKDLDGDGGNPPITDMVNLGQNQTYNLAFRFLDERFINEVKDITEEVRAEATAHLVCLSSASLLLQPNPTDMDANGDPIGLTYTLTTSGPTSNLLQLSLKHQPDKAATDPCSTGDTDVDVTFVVTVQ